MYLKYIIKIIIYSIVLIIISILKNNKSNIEYFNNYRTKCIILVTYITDDNKDMYFKRLNMWLDTGIDIYLVDSNNIGFNIKKNNYNQFIFDQTIEPYYKKNYTNTSILEINSLIKIINYYDLTKKYDYIYKITGKYYIDNYNKLNIHNNEKYDLILQSKYRINISWQNSELVGYKSNKILYYLNLILNHGDGIFERGLGWLKKDKKNTYKILDKIKINNLHGYVPRAAGDTLKYL